MKAQGWNRTAVFHSCQWVRAHSKSRQSYDYISTQYDGLAWFTFLGLANSKDFGLVWFFVSCLTRQILLLTDDETLLFLPTEKMIAHSMKSKIMSGYLFCFQCQFNKNLLQFFINEVDTELLKAIFLQKKKQNYSHAVILSSYVGISRRSFIEILSMMDRFLILQALCVISDLCFRINDPPKFLWAFFNILCLLSETLAARTLRPRSCLFLASILPRFFFFPVRFFPF